MGQSSKTCHRSAGALAVHSWNAGGCPPPPPLGLAPPGDADAPAVCDACAGTDAAALAVGVGARCGLSASTYEPPCGDRAWREEWNRGQM